MTVTKEPPRNDSRIPKRLTEEDLDGIESALRELRHAVAAADFFEAERILQRPRLEAGAVGQLLNDVRRLRTLLKDVASYLDSKEAEPKDKKHQRRLRQLRLRLSAEVGGD